MLEFIKKIKEKICGLQKRFSEWNLMNKNRKYKGKSGLGFSCVTDDDNDDQIRYACKTGLVLHYNYI